MELKQLNLQNFRSYSQKRFVFAKGISLVVGPNTSGKTNLLEAIYLLSTGKSLRAELEAQMINYGSEIARVKGEIKNNAGEKVVLEVVLTSGQINGEKVAKKKYSVNGVGRRMMDFVGNLRVVYFGPEDLEIIVDSPSIRRDYLDSVLEPVDREYRRASLSYKKGLRQRNKLLEQIRDENKPRSVLFFWDKLLIENGEIITQKRQEFIDFVNNQPEYFGKLVLEYGKSLISPQRLEQYAGQETAAGMTLVGPHRDDFSVGIQNSEFSLPAGKAGIKNLHIYGSRGEQRTAVFSLKLAELEFVAQKSGDPSTSSGQGRPILLLDDIFSELDHERRAHLLEIIPKQQTIITTTDLHLIEPEARKKMEMINL